MKLNRLKLKKRSEIVEAVEILPDSGFKVYVAALTPAERESLTDLCNPVDFNPATGRREAMFHGEAINSTEGRAVLHTALRAPDGAPLIVNGEDVRASVRDALAQMTAFAEGIRSASLRTVDNWARQGLLTKRKLPGRQRAAGFSSLEVDRLIV